MKPPFLTDHTPEIGVPEVLAEGLCAVTADNAGAMTFTGTRSYILGESEVAVIDPGPDSPAHLAALLEVLGGRRVSHIIVTHSHVDHSPLAKALQQKTDAPIYAYGGANAARSPFMERLAAASDLGGGEGIDVGFRPDILLADGDSVETTEWRLEAIHTPGHLSNHLCFAWHGMDTLFSGDHVMAWATTLVSPPDGDLTAFMASVRRLQDRPEHTYHAGHGATLYEAHSMLDYLLAHRLGREDQIRAALEREDRSVNALVALMYRDVDPRLHGAAARNVLAHLIDLYERGIVETQGAFDANGLFRLKR